MLLPALDALTPVEYAAHHAAWQRSLEECPHCGRTRAGCSDPEKVWYPQRNICRATMQAAAAQWLYDELHNEKSGQRFHDGTFELWSAEQSRAFPFAHDDGVTIWVSSVDLSPDETWLSEPSAPLMTSDLESG